MGAEGFLNFPLMICGCLLFAFLLLCVIAKAGSTYSVFALGFATATSLVMVWAQDAPSEVTPGFYTNLFFMWFFVWGTIFGLAALVLRAVRRRRA
jgi:hypothetical protein